MFQKGYGLGDLFRNIIRPVLKPVLRETKGIAKDVGMDLAENLLNDLIAGKTSKASVKARGKEVKGLPGQRAVQAILRGHRGGNGNQVPSGSNLSSNTVKRERSQSPKRKQTRSKSKPPKRKRARSKSQPAKRKRTQTGGVQPPIHYPAGNYPRFQTGVFFSNIYRKFKKEREEDCKDWMKRKQKKRKPRKQTGGRRTGKKRKPRKQTGGRRTGKKRKPRKQTGGRRTGKKRKPRKQRDLKLTIFGDIFGI